METSNWESFLNGDNESIRFVFQRYYKDLVFTAYYYVKSEDAAEDVVSDIFCKLLEMPPSKRKKQLAGVNSNLLTFLKVLVKNRCLDRLKVNNNRRVIQKNIFGGILSSFREEPLIENDFNKMLDVLPQQQKIVLELHIKGYSNQQICKELNIAESTTKNTLSNSKKKIRQIWRTFME